MKRILSLSLIATMALVLSACCCPKKNCPKNDCAKCPCVEKVCCKKECPKTKDCPQQTPNCSQTCPKTK